MIHIGVTLLYLSNQASDKLALQAVRRLLTTSRSSSILTRMNWPENCAVVIPCLNEAARIGPLVSEVRKLLPTVIVVDDGSDDETGVIAAQAGAQVLRHAEPRGKGAAMNSGWQRALSLGFSWVLTMDGDGQHAPSDVPAFLHRTAKGQATLIVGNRLAAPQGMPWLRRQVNRWMSRRLTRLAGCDLLDTQCGFRLMNLEAWSKLQIQTSHFEAESELLLAFAAAGQKIDFVPIQVIYQDEESKINPVRDTWRWFRWLANRRG